MKHRRNEQAEENCVFEKNAERHGAGQNMPRSQEHNRRADDTHQAGGGKAHQRRRGESLQNVIEQPLDSARENFFLARFRVVTLHHANAAQRFREPAGNFCIDLRPRAKDRANRLERAVQSQSKNQENGKRHGGHAGADPQEDDHGKNRSQNSPGKLNEPGANEVSHAFDVAHDARDQDASFVCVVERHGQAPHMRLNLDAKFRDHPLRGFRKELRQRIRCEALNDCRCDHGNHDRQ